MELTWEPVSGHTGGLFWGSVLKGQSKQVQVISGETQSQAKGKATLMQPQSFPKVNYTFPLSLLLCSEKKRQGMPHSAHHRMYPMASNPFKPFSFFLVSK